MLRTTALLTIILPAATALAQETRELDAHVHGVSTAEIAIEGGALVIDIFSPGMDIVGFEYAAESVEDRTAVANAVVAMGRAEDIVTVDPAGGCLLTEVLSHIHGDDHGHDEAMAEDDHGHGDEAMDASAEEDDHDHDDGDDHADGDDHDHADEASGEQHSEFHARYAFDCADTDAIQSIAFPFFDAFPNAGEIEASYVTETGAGAAELAPGSATLTLGE